MPDREVAIVGEVALAGVLCLPDDAPTGRLPAVVLLGGTGADTRDGDLQVERAGGPPQPAGPGTLRQIAHALAARRVASLRWDRRGFGSSAGDARTADYGTDLVDALAAFRWLQARPEVDPARIAVAGHSAGALVACRICRDAASERGKRAPAAAALLGALSSPIEDLLASNAERVRRLLATCTAEEAAWLDRQMPETLLRAEHAEEVLAAARAGQETVAIEGRGRRADVRTARLRQDLGTSYEAELSHVMCPALVLHGGDDLNVSVEDALRSYRALRRAGNDDVELVVLPGLEHYFVRVAVDPARRVWERVTQQTMTRPMAPAALDAISRWTVRVLSPGP